MPMIITNPKLKNRIGLTLIIFFTAILVFHFLVLLQVIPYGMVWGGRLQSVQQMVVFELVSIALNLLFVCTVAMESGFIKRILPGKVLKIILWAMIVLFSLNTLGNLNSLNNLETIIFTPVTLILAVLCFLLV